jgi:hypothetical protein
VGCGRREDEGGSIVLKRGVGLGLSSLWGSRKIATAVVRCFPMKADIMTVCTDGGWGTNRHFRHKQFTVDWITDLAKQAAMAALCVVALSRLEGGRGGVLQATGQRVLSHVCCWPEKFSPGPKYPAALPSISIWDRTSILQNLAKKKTQAFTRRGNIRSYRSFS